MKNIILIGMPGAGKSTVGVVLAKKLGYRFLDCDLVIQEKCGKLLYQLIEEQGEADFLALENKINAGISEEKTVIATGGSAVYGKEAMAHFKETGTIVYLKLSCRKLQERLGDLHQRGVVLKEGYTLEDLYKERVPLYEKYADITIDCDGQDIRNVMEKIAADILCREYRL
ncbi:MAG: shikimate kinase [Lachnospiraceae bacterium]|nr:shikimate kinase [Lachnospiraceae bacterium]MDE7331006.1 shikimate kinase [Lachnospiraceae bacterium]